MSDSQHAPQVWLRPEYRGREGELITLGQAADAAGLTRSSISNWISRYADFPRVAMQVERGRGMPTKYIPRVEFLAFAARRLASPGSLSRRTRPRKLSAPSGGKKADRDEDLERHLAAEERRLAAELKGVRAELRTVRNRLAMEGAAASPPEAPQSRAEPETGC
ncbi:hypothetical protein RM780_09670 [Streptomyces sp. DSM 44917]|uniref:Helix-turn-helix domain-containing protein n=1 Tax=Streptomyces boetiae TaxID=3075541 RepID=A0ABU2L6T3_9ACTN|nr:hypothetical protein [Streptomyces sp. DSM 44917]MDT0307230.1 hypothetical protein [Streptomyces sp. DSM 44917]